jgi:hypothetical protein
VYLILITLKRDTQNSCYLPLEIVSSTAKKIRL